MDATVWMLCIALAAAAAAAALLWRSRNFSFDPMARSPPGPKPLPLIGNLFDLRPDLHRRLAELSQQHGPVMSLRLGLSTTVVVSSPDAARDALQKHDQLLASRAVPDIANAFGHCRRSVLWLPSASPLWKQHRAVSASSLFSHRSIDSTRAVRDSKARELVSQLRRRHLGREIPVGLYVYAAVVNTMSNVLFSEDVVDLSSDEPTHGFKDLIQNTVAEFAKPNISELFPFLRALDLQGRRRALAGHVKRLYEFFDGVIERRLSEGKKYGDLLDSLLSTDNYDRHSILALLADLFIAGSDSSATTVEWAMAELLHNPTKMAKLRDENRRAGGGKEAVEEADIADLPYLQAVVKETLRLHPPGPVMLPHLAVADGAEIGGFAISKGTSVIINVFAIMRDPASWPEPDEFIPERFLGKEVDLRGRDFQYIPFGSGRRACPGQPLAATTVPLMLASLVGSFDWRLPEGMSAADVNLEDKFSVALSLAVPLRAVPLPLCVGPDGK